MKDLCFKIIVQLLAMKVAYHNSHNIASRVAFFGDHEALSNFYHELDDDYDAAVERGIGLYDISIADINLIMPQVTSKLQQSFPSIKALDNSALFQSNLKMENELILLIEAICKSPECKESTKQLFSEIGNKSEIRCYKIKRRTVK